MPLPTYYGSQWMESATVKGGPLHVEERVASQPRLLTMTFSQAGNRDTRGDFSPCHRWTLSLRGDVPSVSSDCLVDRLVS